MISRRGLLMAFLAVPATVIDVAAKPGFHITGKLDCTEQEAQEGYFAVGKDFAVVARPNSPVHDDLLMMRGLEIQASIFVP